MEKLKVLKMKILHQFKKNNQKRCYFLYAKGRKDEGGIYVVAYNGRDAIRYNYAEMLLSICDEYTDIRAEFYPDLDVQKYLYGILSDKELAELGIPLIED